MEDRPARRLVLLMLGILAIGQLLAGCGTEPAVAQLRIAMKPRTIVDFARDLGLSRVTVNDWTLGNSEPRLTSAMRAAAELGVSLHGLCDGRVEWRAP